MAGTPQPVNPPFHWINNSEFRRTFLKSAASVRCVSDYVQVIRYRPGGAEIVKSYRRDTLANRLEAALYRDAYNSLIIMSRSVSKRKLKGPGVRALVRMVYSKILDREAIDMILDGEAV